MKEKANLHIELLKKKKGFNQKRSQVSIEYLLIVGFVSAAVITILFIAYLYSGSAQDKITDNQIQVLADKLINSAESVYFAGSPSQATITVFVPKSINSIDIVDINANGAGKDILITTSSHSGEQRRIFSSNVYIKFKDMSNDDKKRLATEGNKRIRLTATVNEVEFTLV